jgi:hypothetical protein
MTISICFSKDICDVSHGWSQGRGYWGLEHPILAAVGKKNRKEK